MNQEKTRQPGQKPDEGFSLIMSLIFISLLSILVVGFLTSMRSEVSSAEEHARSTKAASIAQMGTDMALSRLRFAAEATSSSTISGTYWITQPGRISTVTNGFSVSSATTSIDLHSGRAGVGDSADSAADLNQGASHLLANSPDVWKVQWIYLRKDGTLIPGSATAPTYSLSNPIIGRFAFWVDDASSRINLNTAFTRTTSDTLSNPFQQNLKIFSGINDADLVSLKNYRTGTVAGGHLFNTVKEARAVSASLSTLVENNKFSFTVDSQAPDVNMFGEPRIVLTTQKSLAGNAPFLDILTNTYSDPGLFSNLDPAKVNAVVKTISDILCRTDWPYKTGVSLAGKFSPVRPQEVALNIIEYVRAKESGQAMVEALRGDITGTNSFSTNAESGSFGNARSVKITEVSIDVIQTDTKGSPTATDYDRYKFIIRTELHLPPNFGVASVDLKKFRFAYAISNRDHLQSTYSWWYLANASAVSSRNPNVYGNGIICETYSKPISSSGDPYLLKAGEYREIVTTTDQFAMLDKGVGIARTRADLTRIQPSFALRNDTTAANGARIEWVALGDYTTTMGAPLFSKAVDDPCVNKSGNNWMQQSLASMSFGTFSGTSLRTLGTANLTATTTTAQQDLDASSLITNVGMRFPAPAGAPASAGIPANSGGVMESVAELGFVHSGVCNSAAGVPWRTLRFQPQKNSTSMLPDWLLLDMFTVPKYRWVQYSDKTKGVTTNSYFVQGCPPPATDTLSQRMSLVGGQVNLNHMIVPFTTAANAAYTRSDPLRSVLTGAYTKADQTATLSYATTENMFKALFPASPTLSTALGNSGSRYGNTWPIYLSRGEIIEYAGLADGGEESENRLLGVIDLLTTRGSVFQIYSVGQSITQSPAGAITVMGEDRTETVVSRVMTSSNSTTAKFKTVYSGKVR